MPAYWDTRSLADQRREQNALLRQAVLEMGLGHVPLVRRALAAAGIDPRTFKGVEELSKLRPVMRRDVFDPKANPDGPRGLILRPTEEGVKRFSERSILMKIAAARITGGEEVQQLAIEAVSRPIHTHLVAGPGGTIPVAYTRADLDVLARAGARAGRVMGLERDERLLNLVPFGPTLDFWGVFYMAHGLGMSPMHARRYGGELSEAMAAIFDSGRPTVVVVPADEASWFPGAAAEGGLDLGDLRVLIAVGRSLTPDERQAAATGLAEAGASQARIAAMYGPAEGHTLWAECSVPPEHTQAYGFHTYPDLELIEILSPESSEALAQEKPGEIAVTPLAFRGGAAPRWRTGDLAVGGITTRPCPNCGRTVPRVGPGVRRDAWRRTVSLNGSETTVDLREASMAVGTRSRDWQLELVTRAGGADLFVYIAPQSDDPESVIDLYEELERLDAAPTQIVLASQSELDRRKREAGGAWPRLWERSEG